MLHFGSGVRIFCRFLLRGGGAWLCPRRLCGLFSAPKENQDEVQLVEEVEVSTIRADQKAMRFVAARCQQTILLEVHQNPSLICAVTAPQVRTLLALEVRLDVGFLDEAVDAVQK